MTAMESDTFEKAFSDFIERHEYDEAQSALFDMIRISFQAGWESAGGNPSEPQPVIRLIHKKPDEEPPK